VERSCQARTGLDLTVPKDCMARKELCVPGISIRTVIVQKRLSHPSAGPRASRIAASYSFSALRS